MPVGERHTGVIADTAHDEVIADEQRVLHRAGGNDARLADRAVDEQKNEADPEPGDDLALNLSFHGQIRFFLLFLFLSFHVPPPPAALRTRTALAPASRTMRTFLGVLVPRKMESSTITTRLPSIKPRMGLGLSFTPKLRMAGDGSMKVRQM